MDDNYDEEWPAQLSRRIGAAIQAAREAQDVSAVKLAARTAELGYPIHRVAISKLESGKRDITVPELVIVAAALNTVPLALLLPGTVDETIEILPGREMTGAAAIGWFTGTTSATPPGVTRDRAVTSRLELTMRLNEVNEHLSIQLHNLFQTESSLKTFAMPDALRDHQLEVVKHTRKLVESLENQRDSILHMLAQNGDRDGG
jgi:transcriptional regulator with XRE-family HTH domain